jgi:hypothetical protein
MMTKTVTEAELLTFTTRTDNLLSVAEAAEAARTTPSKIRTAIRSGRLDPTSLVGTLYVHVGDLADALNHNRL